MGIVYLLHFEEPIGEPLSDELRAEYGHGPRKVEYKPHAQHYLGYTDNSLESRIERHQAGNGARLVEVAIERNIGFQVARIWKGNQNLEKKLKNQKQGPRLCPICCEERKKNGD